MRRTVPFGVAVGVALLMTAAADAGHHRARQVGLSIVPLPKSELGPTGKSLRLDLASGFVSNADAAFQSAGYKTVKMIARAGRITGYRLTYGDFFSGHGVIRAITTSVVSYRTARDAAREITSAAREITSTQDKSFASSMTRFGVPTTARWAVPPEQTTRAEEFSTTRIGRAGTTLYTVRERTRAARYLCDAIVTGSRQDAVGRLAAVLSRRLVVRLDLALQGRLHARAVRIPKVPKPGPPATGPKPARLALLSSDLGGSKVMYSGYRPTNYASLYDVDFKPAGPFAALYQNITDAVTHGDAVYFRAGALLTDSRTPAYPQAASTVQMRVVPLGAIGDSALGEIVRVPLKNGRSSYEAIVGLVRGQYMDLVDATRSSPISNTDMAKLARSVASRLDSGLGG